MVEGKWFRKVLRLASFNQSSGVADEYSHQELRNVDRYKTIQGEGKYSNYHLRIPKP